MNVCIKTIGVSLFTICAACFSRSVNAEESGEKSPTRLADIVSLLETNHCEPVVLKGKDENHWVVVTPKLTGRVMSLSADGAEGRSSAFINEKQIKDGFSHAGKGDWNNFGGIERIWFAPEGGKYGYFFTPGEEQNWDNYLIPKSMQGIEYKVTQKSADGQSVTFAAPIELENYQKSKIKLDVVRKISVLDDCPYALETKAGAKVVGFESRTMASNAGKETLNKDTTPLSIWTLGILNNAPHQIVLLPYRTGTDAELGTPVTTEYFRYFLTAPEMPKQYWSVKDGCVMIKADGKVKTKFEMLKRRALGRLASIDLEHGRIVIVEFGFYPEMDYTASYNLPFTCNLLDGGVLSTFMNEGEPLSAKAPAIHELECMSPILELAPEKSYTHISRTWQIDADAESLDQICSKFFNVDLETLRSFDASSHLE